MSLELYKTKILGKKNGSKGDAFYDLKTGVELLKLGGFALHTDSSNGYDEVIEQDFSNDMICELGEVLLYGNQYMTGVIQQFSVFKELLLNRYPVENLKE